MPDPNAIPSRVVAVTHSPDSIRCAITALRTNGFIEDASDGRGLSIACLRHIHGLGPDRSNPKGEELLREVEEAMR